MIRVARFEELDPRTLYRILRLRSDVFVVEQACAYPDLDGRDVEDATIHLWADPDPTLPTVAAALRILVDAPGRRRIGRVVTAPSQRGLGLAGALVERALTLVPDDATVVLDAQARLEAWYRTWGFDRCGADFLEDGIVHVPMQRPPGVGARS